LKNIPTNINTILNLNTVSLSTAMGIATKVMSLLAPYNREIPYNNIPDAKEPRRKYFTAASKEALLL
jgi:hypothetical protein